MVLRIHASVHENPKIYEFKNGEKKTEIYYIYIYILNILFITVT